MGKGMVKYAYDLALVIVINSPLRTATLYLVRAGPEEWYLWSFERA